MSTNYHENKIKRPRSMKNNLTLVGKVKDAAGKIYGRLANGQLVRLKPLKPWSGKSERRQVLRHRREDRALAAANA